MSATHTRHFTRSSDISAEQRRRVHVDPLCAAAQFCFHGEIVATLEHQLGSKRDCARRTGSSSDDTEVGRVTYRSSGKSKVRVIET